MLCSGAGGLGLQRLGRKYSPFDLDNAVPGHIAKWSGRRRFTPGIILEGGAIDSNGRAAILTTEQCLLNSNRNPQLDRDDMERYLAIFSRRRCCGSARELKATTPTDTSTNWLVSWARRTVVAERQDDPDR